MLEDKTGGSYRIRFESLDSDLVGVDKDPIRLSFSFFVQFYKMHDLSVITTEVRVEDRAQSFWSEIKAKILLNQISEGMCNLKTWLERERAL